MAVVKKINPNRLFITKRLEERLKNIYEYPVTVVEAPTGYGKTTAVKEFLKQQGKPYIWFNIDSDNREKTFLDFCNKIKGINETAASRIMSIGYPRDDAAVKQVVAAINSITFFETTVFVVDNYNLVSDKNLDAIIKDLSGSAAPNVRIVILTQVINSKGTFEMIMNRKLYHITKADFALDKEDIIQYYKLCGIKLEDSESEFLYKYTEGWISALYLQMLSFSASNTFEMTVDIENLIGKAIWYNLDRESQDFLIGISVFNSFTLRQCIYIADGAMAEEKIEKLLNGSGFIRYDAKERKYFMHSILKYFLESEFDKLEVIFRKKILKKAGNWYRDNESYADAIELYYKYKDYEAILAMNFGVDILHKLHLDLANKSIFMDITTNAPNELKRKYLKTYILFIYFLALDNEREYYRRECENTYNIIEKYYRDDEDYNELLGEYYVLQCFNSFNNLDEMKENLDRAYELLKRPSRILDTKTSFLFAGASPFAMYHGTAGSAMDEAAKLDAFMPVYYRLTDGKCKGVEALFRAELLLMRGELNDSLKLCEKAIYMCSSKNQTEIHISTLMCICRIAYLRGNTEMLKESIEQLKKYAESGENIETILQCDLCLGFVNAAVNNGDKIPVWLTDYKMIERNTIIMGLGFANLIYGKYLLLKENYTSFLSISGKMLDAANIYNNIVYQVYTLIYIAIAKNQTGDRGKAKKILFEAIEIAEKDGLYIPFVENYNMLGSVLGEMNGMREGAEFIKKVNELAKKYIKGLQSSERSTSKNQRFGLTKREMEVAQLAASRLSNKEIADQLFIAESTVKSNLKVIFNKLGINSRNELKNIL